MNKRKLAAFVLGAVMACSGVLGACNVKGNDLDSDKAEQNGSQQGDRDLLNDPPKRDEATGNQTQNGTVSEPEYLSPDMSYEAAQEIMNAYRLRSEEEHLAHLGIGKDDYVWTIVSLKGGTVLDQYKADGSKLSVAEYVGSDGRNLRDNMLANHQRVKNNISTSIDSEAEFSYSYTLADNGFAAKVKYGDVERIRALSTVSSVRIAEQYAAPQSSNLETLYSSDSNSSSANDPNAGVGSFVAILDTAIDAVPEGYKDKNGNIYPGHAAFRGNTIDMDTAAVDINDIAIAYKGTVAFEWNIAYNGLTSEPDVNNVYYNNKLVFAFDYGNKDTFVLPYMVEELEHGNHSAGIAVGCDEEAGFYGVAPRAQFAFMKVFYEDTSNWLVYSNDTDIAAAIEDCIILGVDAINLSLGSPRGFSVNNTTGTSYYIYEFCRYADLVGINVQAAVGNNFTGAYAGVTGDMPLADYPDYGALNSPASYDSTLAVASYDGSNIDHYYGVVNENSNNTFKIQVTDPVDSTFMKSAVNSKGLNQGTYEIVYVGGEGNYSDFVKAGAEGKIAVVTTRKITETSALYQWVQGRQFAADQMANAIRAGAKAILYADRDYRTYRTIECNLDATIALPFGAISRLDAEQLIAIGGKATIRFSDELIAHDLMSAFSSWGPTNTLNIKPEIVGVGGNVYSSISSPGLKHNSTGYGVMSGTSMAAPQITGYSTLLKTQLREKYPEKTDKELSTLVNQLLMSTATPLSDISGNIYSPRYQGAGAANYEAASKMQAYLSVTGQTKPKIELGEDEKRSGVYFLNFNLTNIGGSELKYKLATDVMTDSLALDGKTVSLVPHMFDNYAQSVTVSNATYLNNVITVAPNSTASVAITVRLTDAQKKYIDENFKYGSYVEGFVKLIGANDSVVDMSIPFLAFYGDWEKSALLDTTVFDKEDAYLYASRLVGTYYGGYFSALLGQYQYKVPENFSFVTEENGQYVKSDKVTTFKDIQYDPNRLAIGSKTGGFDAISYIYFGLLRNADSVEVFITDVDTGIQYAYTKLDQLGRASFVESSGGMMPVSLYAGYGRSLPNNAKIKLSIRATYNNIGDTINVNDQTDFYITVDSEAPSLYRSSLGLVEQNGRTYLSIDVFDNHYLSSVGIYGTTPDGVRSLLGDPLPVDMSTWKPNQINTLVYDVTDYIKDFTGTFSVLLEDSAMNAVSFALASLTKPTNPDDGKGEEDVFATKIEFNSEMNLASTYSTDLGIVTYPANAKYSLSVVPVSEMTPAEQEKYAGTAYIDEANLLVVAQKAGYVKIKIMSGDIVEYADVYIYVIDGEWMYELNTGWLRHYDEATGVIDNTFYKYDPAQPDRRFYTVYAYQGEGTHVTVPTTYVDPEGKEYPILGLGYGSFRYDFTLISITIPKQITTIVDSAFEYNTSLQKVIFEEGSDLCIIMSMAFENCRSLESIELPASLVQLDSRAFYGCEKLKDITFSAYTKEEGARLRAIQYSAFAYCPIEEFRFPETVETTGSAFTGITTLKKLELPESLKDLGTYTGCTSLEEVYIPSQITLIPQSAFYGCISLKKINIPDSVTRIGSRAFYMCESLREIELPKQFEKDANGNPVTFKIDDEAFAGCTRLINIQLPNTVTDIGKGAFLGCVSLHTLYFDRNTTINEFGTDVFSGCVTFTEFIVHPANPSFMSDDGILYREIPGQEGSYELYYVPVSKVVTTMLIRPDVAVIRDFAFMNHSELQTVLFSSAGKLYKIGNYAFANCVNLKTMNLENAKSLSSIGSYAFAGCQSLTSVVFPTSLTVISDYAFYMDLYLENITLHDNITRIGNYAFGFCIRLEGTDGNGTLKLPARLQTLGTAAFVLNRSLYKVDMGACMAYAGTTSAGGEAAFESCYKLKEVILPSSLSEMPQYMFDDCIALEKVNLGDTKVETIRSYAFANCTSLKEVTLPDTLEWLYSYTFAFSGLTSIKLPDRMAVATRQIWSYAFAGCTNLSEVSVPSDMYEVPIYAFAQTAIKEFTVPRGIKSSSGLSSYAFYLCSQLERFYVEEGNPTFEVTDEGILYMKATESNDALLYICPPNLQAEELVLDRMFTSIPVQFFQLVSGIKKIVVPNSVKTVNAGAFYYSKIEEVEFEAGSDLDFKPYVHYSIFEGCTNLRKVVLPDHMTSVSAAMFYGCENLTEIELPESVIAIYDDAFTLCTGLTSINLENVEFLGGSAFMFCEGLRNVYLGKNLSYFCTDVNYKVFEGCSGLEEIKVHEDNKILKDIDGVLFDKGGSILYVYPAAKQGSEYIIPEGVTKVDELSFGYNKYLQKVVLPETLKSVGTFAFYHTEQLDEYVFLCNAAPTLEGQYSPLYGRTLYANFYSFYSNDFSKDGVSLTMYIPEGATGYDMWLYGYFFDQTLTVEDGKFTPPSQGDVTVPDDKPIPPATGSEFGDRLQKRIEELSVGASDSLKSKLQALWVRFNAESSAFGDEIADADAFDQFENAFIAEAESIYDSENEFFAAMWTRIHHIYNTVSELRGSGKYSDDNVSLMDTMAYSAQYVIIRQSTLDGIEYYYHYYLSVIEGIPTEDGLNDYAAYQSQKLDELDAEYDAFKATANSMYDADVIEYVEEIYVDVSMNISGAMSRGIIDDQLEVWNHTIKNVVKKADRAEFDRIKAEQLARFDKYKAEDYDYALWSGVGLPAQYIGIREFIDQQRAIVEGSFIIEDIINTMDYACAEIAKQTSKLDSVKDKLLTLLDSYIDNYTMYTYLFDEQKIMLRNIVADVKAQIKNAESVEAAQEALDRGFERVWNFYEYYQKAHTEYRRAEELFANLSAEVREQAMKELKQISWRAAENWLAIRALIEKYCG